MARRTAKGSFEDTHVPPSPVFLLMAYIITGMVRNGRVNGPGHLTPCNEFASTMGGALFVPFRHDQVVAFFRTQVR